jgi:hypothetical protein
MKDGGLGGRMNRRDRELLADWKRRAAELRQQADEMQRLGKQREALEKEMLKGKRAVEQAQLDTARNTGAIRDKLQQSLDIAK